MKTSYRLCFIKIKEMQFYYKRHFKLSYMAKIKIQKTKTVY